MKKSLYLTAAICLLIFANIVVYPIEKDNLDESIKLTLDAEPIEAEFSQAEEVDWYSFSVSEASIISVETFGTSDTVIALYGPDDQEVLIMENDDGSENLCSLIENFLSPGTYWVKVWEYGMNDMGSYSISVTNVNLEPNNTADDANEISIWGNSLIQLLEDEQDVDWAFFANEYSQILIINAESEDLDTYVQLFSEDDLENPIIENDNSGRGNSGLIAAYLEPGLYYIRVSLGESGEFNLQPYNLAVYSIEQGNGYEPYYEGYYDEDEMIWDESEGVLEE